MLTYFSPESWLEVLGWVSLSLAFASTLYLASDILLRGYRQKMWIMNIVYPVTALYWSLATVWFYLRYGRRSSKRVIAQHGPPDPEQVPQWVTTTKAITHCGAGCTLGDIVAEWLVFALGLSIAHKAVYADFFLDFGFAWLFGVVFQYFTIVPMRSIGPWRGIWAAIKADTLSIVAFQAGLFLGMWIYQELIFAPGLPKTTSSYWMMMQVSMVLGFFTAWPVNVWLVRVGWKERM